MKLPARLTALLLLALAACQTPGTYPVSGEECSPNDPVLGLEAPPCP
jgi:hypothetical protein